MLVCGQWQARVAGLEFKRVTGGLLVQDRDLGMVEASQLRVVSKRQPSEQELRDALFCWKVAKFVKSNAIVYARDNMTIGIGAGRDTDAQVLVWQDMAELPAGGFAPKFVRRFGAIGAALTDAARDYRDAVASGDFPGEEHAY